MGMGPILYTSDNISGFYVRTGTYLVSLGVLALLNTGERAIKQYVLFGPSLLVLFGPMSGALVLFALSPLVYLSLSPLFFVWHLAIVLFVPCRFCLGPCHVAHAAPPCMKIDSLVYDPAFSARTVTIILADTGNATLSVEFW